MSAILEVKNVWINYRTIKPFSYKNLIKKSNNKSEIFTAVEDVSFTLNRGECLGIIGANGAGKSTLLRAIGNIYSPDKGKIDIFCERTSLLALGIGFQTRLSGKKNILLSGLAMGLTLNEINEKMENIIKFSELGDFIDKPIKNYSNGMQSKLAFSISVELKSELLLIDEILSVGDMKFSEKSYNRIREIISHKEQSVIIVSHNINTLHEICNRVLWLDSGQVKTIGEPDVVISQYKKFMAK